MHLINFYYYKPKNYLYSKSVKGLQGYDVGYGFSFNGKELDKGNEGMGGGGSTYDYGFRVYNAQLGRFLSVDPLEDDYPWYSTYQFAGNNPIRFIDLDGLEESDPIPESYYNNKTKISMVNAPESSARNAAGFKRNGPWYWKQMLKMHPEMFDEENRALIKRNRSPIVNEQWVKYSPTHIGFMSDKLIHHHFEQGNYAYALPEKVHNNWSKVLHATYKAGRPTTQGVLNYTLNTFGLFFYICDLVSDAPHTLKSSFECISGNTKIGKLYYDNKSEYYFQPIKVEKEYYKSGALKSVSVTYDYYDGYYYDADKKSYQGFEKKGTKIETNTYDEKGNKTSSGEGT